MKNSNMKNSLILGAWIIGTGTLCTPIDRMKIAKRGSGQVCSVVDDNYACIPPYFSLHDD